MYEWMNARKIEWMNEWKRESRILPKNLSFAQAHDRMGFTQAHDRIGFTQVHGQMNERMNGRMIARMNERERARFWQNFF